MSLTKPLPRPVRLILINALVPALWFVDYMIHARRLVFALDTIVVMVCVNLAFFTERRFATILMNIIMIWQFFFRDWLLGAFNIGSAVGGVVVLLFVNSIPAKPNEAKTKTRNMI